MPATGAPPLGVTLRTGLPATTGSLKVAVTAVPVVGTPVAPAAGDRSVTVGLVVSTAVLSNTTSTQ